MPSKMGYIILYISMLFCSNLFAQTHAFTPNLNIEYELPPNYPQEFINLFFWTITAKCMIFSTDESNDVFAELLNKKAVINENILSQGDTVLMTVHPGDNLFIIAYSGSKVRLTNKGEHTIRATCSS